MEREMLCVCGETFMIPVKRGRPAVRCPECREAHANGTLADRLWSRGIDTSLRHARAIKSDGTSTPSDPTILAEREAEKELSKKRREAEELVDRLEFKLRMAGNHISQHRDKWE